MKKKQVQYQAISGIIWLIPSKAI